MVVYGAQSTYLNETNTLVACPFNSHQRSARSNRISVVSINRAVVISVLQYNKNGKPNYFMPLLLSKNLSFPILNYVLLQSSELYFCLLFHTVYQRPSIFFSLLTAVYFNVISNSTHRIIIGMRKNLTKIVCNR